MQFGSTRKLYSSCMKREECVSGIRAWEAWPGKLKEQLELTDLILYHSVHHSNFSGKGNFWRNQ